MKPIGLTGFDPALTFHGLRTNATSALIEAGCTEEEARSITGHKITQMINKYSIGVRQKRMADRVKNIWGK
jgi:integrase